MTSRPDFSECFVDFSTDYLIHQAALGILGWVSQNDAFLPERKCKSQITQPLNSFIYN